ncbi:MAG: hypothetical protein HRF46_15380 [Acidobacteriota bacterium]
MSGLIRRRPRWHSLIPRLALVVGAVVLTGSIAAALQVRRVHVEGVGAPIRTRVEEVLAAAVGSPTLTVRAEELRAAVLHQVPWVADAAVSVSLDGVVHCAVTLRRPMALLVDGARFLLVDDSGRILGEAQGESPLPSLELIGFAAHPEERATLLAALPALETAWGGEVRRVERLGPRDVALQFVDGPAVVIADPSHPARLADGRAVLTAWTQRFPTAVQRLDVRAPGRVAVAPATDGGNP